MVGRTKQDLDEALRRAQNVSPLKAQYDVALALARDAEQRENAYTPAPLSLQPSQPVNYTRRGDIGMTSPQSLQLAPSSAYAPAQQNTSAPLTLQPSAAAVNTNWGPYTRRDGDGMYQEPRQASLALQPSGAANPQQAGASPQLAPSGAQARAMRAEYGQWQGGELGELEWARQRERETAARAEQEAALRQRVAGTPLLSSADAEDALAKVRQKQQENAMYHMQERHSLQTAASKEERQLLSLEQEYYQRELKRLQGEEFQAQLDAGAREMSVGDLLNSFSKGEKGTALNQAYYAQMMGREHNAAALEEELADERYNYVTRNKLLGGADLALGLVGQWKHSAEQPETMALATMGASAGTLSGALAGSPILGVGALPGAAAGAVSGFGTGLSMGIAKQTMGLEAGAAWKEMIDAGVDEETAKNIALVVGGVNAGLEFVQLKSVSKAYRALAGNSATRSAARKLAAAALEYGMDVAKETGQEVLQEGVTVAGSNLGRALSGLPTDSAREIAGRLGETAVDSAIGFALLKAPAGAISAGQHVAARPRTLAGDVNIQAPRADFARLPELLQNNITEVLNKSEYQAITNNILGAQISSFRADDGYQIRRDGEIVAQGLSKEQALDAMAKEYVAAIERSPMPMAKELLRSIEAAPPKTAEVKSATPGELQPSAAVTQQVGQATTIYHPYQGPVPVQEVKANRVQPVIDAEKVQMVYDQIVAAGEEAVANQQSVRGVLRKTYNNLFERTGGARSINVEGVSFDGQPYTVTVNKSAVSKVISDTNLSPEKLAVFYELDNVIKNGEYVGSGAYAPKSGTRDQNITRYDYFETPAKIGGESFIVAYDVAVSTGHNNYRTHKVINKIDLTPTPSGEVVPVPTAQGASSSLSEPIIPQQENSVNVAAQKGDSASFKTGGGLKASLSGDAKSPSDTSLLLKAPEVNSNALAQSSSPLLLEAPKAVEPPAPPGELEPSDPLQRMLLRERGVIDSTLEPDPGDEWVKERTEAFDALLREYDITDEGAGTKEAGGPYDDIVARGVKPGQAQVLTEVPKRRQPLKQRSADGAGALRRMFIDSLESIDRVGKLSGDEYLYDYADMVRRAPGRVEDMLTRAQVNYDGNQVGPSLKAVWAPIDAKDTGYKAKFMTYLLHMRNIEDMEYARNLSRVTGVAVEDMDFAPIKSKPVFGYEVTADVSRAEVAAMLKENPEFSKLAEPVYEYNNNLLQYRVQAGLMNQDDANFLKELRPHYVPIGRDLDARAMPETKDAVVIGRSLNRALGGNGDILPIDVVMARRTSSVVRQSAKNMLAQRLFEIAENSNAPEVDRFVRLNETERQVAETGARIEAAAKKRMMENPDEIIRQADEGVKLDEKMEKGTGLNNMLTVWRDGRLREMEINDGLYFAFQDLGSVKTDTNIAVKAVTKGNELFKRGVTGDNPFFTVRNMIRDEQEALIYSRNTLAYIKAKPRAVKEMFANGAMWQRYLALGGKTFGSFDYETGQIKRHGALFENTLGRIERMNDFVEHVPRFTEFLATVDEGGTGRDNLMRAMHNANEITVNFSRGGKTTKMLNRTIAPYLNPAVQGADKFFRNISGQNGTKGQAAAILSLLAKVLLVNVIPSALNELIYGDDDDYQNLTDRDKDTHYLIKLPNNTWLKLPKVRELAMFGNAVQRMIRQLKGEKNPWAGYFSQAVGDILPPNPFTTGLYEPIRSMSTNKNWYGADIETAAMQRLPVAMRTDSSVDALSEAIGQTLAAQRLGLSPKKINYLLDSYTGVLGDIALPLGAQRSHRNILMRNFVIDGEYSNKISQEFYGTLSSIEQAKNAVKSDVPTEDALLYRYLSKQAQAVSDMYAEIREVEGSDLPNQEKQHMARELKVVLNGVQQAVLDGLDEYREVLTGQYARYVDPAADEATREDQAEKAYREANREAFGADYALRTYNKSAYIKAAEAERQGISFDAYYDYYFAKQEYDAKASGVSEHDFVRRWLLGSKLNEAQRQYLWKADGYAGNINAWSQAERELKNNVQYLALPEDKREKVLEDVAAYYDEADPVATLKRYMEQWQSHYSGNPTDKHGQTTAKDMGISRDTYLQYREGLAAGGDTFQVINALPLSVEKKEWLDIEDAKNWKASEDKVGGAIAVGLTAGQYYTYAAYIGTLDAANDKGETVTNQKKQRTFDYIKALPLTAVQKEYLWKAAGYKDFKGVNGSTSGGSNTKSVNTVRIGGPSFKSLYVPSGPSFKGL